MEKDHREGGLWLWLWSIMLRGWIIVLLISRALHSLELEPCLMSKLQRRGWMESQVSLRPGGEIQRQEWSTNRVTDWGDLAEDNQS